MRRLLMVCAVVVLATSLFSLFAIAQKTSPSVDAEGVDATAGPTAESQSTAIETASGHTPVVLASGIAVRSVALDSHANIYVTNASAPNRIFTLTSVENVLGTSAANPFASARLGVVAGNGTAGSLGDGGAALASQFDLKLDSLLLRSGIAIAPEGTMLIADTLNSTIRRIAGSDSSEPGIIRSIAGHWGPRQEITLTEPLGLALDRAENLYIADRASGTLDVLPFAGDSPSTSQLAIVAHLAYPASIALAPDGRQAFVASPDTGAIFAIDTQTHAIRAVTGFAPQSNSTQQASRCTAQNSSASENMPMCPVGLAVDGAGNLFVADANSGRILRVDAKSQQLTVAASGLKSPGDMSFDASGNLYVAEQGANRLVEFAAMGDPASNLSITPPAALPPPPGPRVCPSAPPGYFNFCDQPTGGATPTQDFKLVNSTSAALTGLSISLTGSNAGDFQISSNNCGTSVPTTGCDVYVDFAPAAAHTSQAMLSVSDAAGDNATASLYGTGDDYEIVLNGTNQEQSVYQGGSVTFKFNVAPDAVFGGVVTIVCPASSQLPSLSTCTPNPATVTVTPGSAAPFSVTFATTYNGVLAGTTMTGGSVPAIASYNADNDSPHPPRRWPFLGVSLLLAALAFWLGRSHRATRRSASVAWLLLACTIACTTFVLGACKHSSIQPGLNTPVGVTNLTINSSAQNAARGNTIILDVVAH